MSIEYERLYAEMTSLRGQVLKKNERPKIDPWGTPVECVHGVDVDPCHVS